MRIAVCREGHDIGEWEKAEFDRLVRTGAVLPTDHYWTEGMADWQLVKEYWLPTAAPGAASAQRPAEREYYNKDGVMVTASRFTVGKTMYPIRNIASVNTVSVRPDRAAIKVLLGLLLFFFIIAVGVADSAPGIWALPICVLVLIVVIAIAQKPSLAVQVLTGGGEKDAFVDKDEQVVRAIVAALHEAVVNYRS